MHNILHLICQAHLDPVWLWTWRDGLAEALTTLQSAVDRLHEFPAMRYSCSSAAFYRWVKQTDPRLFREIRALVDEGRWEPVGGWVVQADTLLPSESSLRRQGELGQAWFKRYLGVTCQIGYCVDSFGHSAGLPSILRAAGMRYYVFQRPDPRERPDLPNLFWWEAPDGARVLTWRLAAGYGQAPGSGADRLDADLRAGWRTVMAPGMSEGAWFVGVGNHGGGPTRAQIGRLEELRQREDPTLPALRFSSLSDFFVALERQAAFNRIPVIRGELVHHARGCYAANTRFKRLHRQAERDLRTVEALQAIYPPGQPAPDLDQAWWTLCFNQFHDILPGSSVAAAYDQARDELGAVRHVARRLTVTAVHRQARHGDARDTAEGALFLVNPLPWARTAIVHLDTFVAPHGESPITHLADAAGDTIALQWTSAEAGFGPYLQPWKKLVAAVPLPAAGHRRLQMAHGEAPRSSPAVPDSMESTLQTLRLVAIDDRADTWGHDVDRWDQDRGCLAADDPVVLDDGPVFRRLRRRMAGGTSTVLVDMITWHALKAVELVLHIDWQDRYQALKLELPLDMSAARLFVRTPAAVVQRPWDADEWFWGDWMAVRNAQSTLLLVSDGVSAYDATPDRLRLTLLRCVPHAQYMACPPPPDDPSPFLDQGFQQARFWLTALPAEYPAESLDRLATGFLTPAQQMLDSAHPGAGEKSAGCNPV